MRMIFHVALNHSGMKIVIGRWPLTSLIRAPESLIIADPGCNYDHLQETQTQTSEAYGQRYF